MKQRSPLVQIDPDRALCWEEGATLRVGFDEAIARVRPASRQAQRLVRALVSGVRQSDLDDMIEAVDRGRRTAQRLRLRREFDEVLEGLEPVLVRHERAPEPTSLPAPIRTAIRAALADDGREVRGIRESLRADWLCSFESGPAPPELAIQVLRFLEPLERTRRWLGEGIPQLLIRFTDTTVLVGPLVSAHGAPCHGCEVLALTEADPALPSIAAQLYGRVPSTESPQLSWLAGAVAASYVRAWQEGALWVHDSQLALPAAGGCIAGLPTLRRIAPHPECGCSLDLAKKGA